MKRSAVFSGRHVPSTLRDFGAQNGIIFRSYDDTWKYMRKFGIKNLKGYLSCFHALKTLLLEARDQHDRMTS